MPGSHHAPHAPVADALDPSLASLETNPPRSSYLMIRGLRYHVRSWGREGAPKLFMLHGWMDCSASWQFFANAFRRDVHLIAPDWRGYGLSEWGHTDTYWYPELIGDLDHLVSHYSPHEPINLLAHSMGGGLASLYAGTRPERIARYVNMEAYGMMDDAGTHTPQRYEQWLKRLQHRARSPGFGSYEEMAARLRKTNGNLTEPRSLYLAHHLGKTNADGRIVLRCDPRHKDFFSNPVMYLLEEVRACWKNITAPVLWIEADDGTDDSRQKRIGAAGIAERKSHIRNRRDVFFDSTSHQVHIERPERLAAEVERFFNETATPTDTPIATPTTTPASTAGGPHAASAPRQPLREPT